MDVLLIEDDRGISEAVVEMLRLNQMSVTCAYCCNDALEVLTDFKPDIIISDIMLPDGTGFDILRFLRNDTTIIDYIPFIFLSGRAAHQDIRQGMNLGADDYLTKPFEYEDLIQTIRTVYEKNQVKHQHLTKLEGELASKMHQIDQVKSITSHDLRSRVVKIFNMIELLREEKLPKEKFIDWMMQSGEYFDEVMYKIHEILNESMNQPASYSGSLHLPKSMWHVEDDVIQRMFVKSIVDKSFAHLDYQSFDNANEALGLMLQGEFPDYILLDINMPGMSGFELLDAMREKQLNTQVIMLSSSISDTDIVESYTYQNVVGYEVKPLKKEVFNHLFGLG
ncbi:response regulator [Marinoscillum pacificum]|uniref:response regulator n=1 Tax=Marinoscillum pacificum TaxID=392723 RepID=UPI00215886A4|nr:response regulator [Marinoscillum pacificum]